jgi:hypothetical protein
MRGNRPPVVMVLFLAVCSIVMGAVTFTLVSWFFHIALETAAR